MKASKIHLIELSISEKRRFCPYYTITFFQAFKIYRQTIVASQGNASSI